MPELQSHRGKLPPSPTHIRVNYFRKSSIIYFRPCSKCAFTIIVNLEKISHKAQFIHIVFVFLTLDLYLPAGFAQLLIICLPPKLEVSCDRDTYCRTIFFQIYFQIVILTEHGIKKIYRRGYYISSNSRIFFFPRDFFNF